jgi:hypothetical protein
MSTDDGKQGGFYQFPLCLLAQPIPFRELLEQSFGWGVVHYLDTKFGESWRQQSAKSQEEVISKARAAMKFDDGKASNFVSRFAVAQRFIDGWKRNHGQKTAFVRFRTADLYFDVRDHEIISERDWRVLAGVYSALGDKRMVTIGWERIQFRAAGWLTRPKLGATACGPLYPRGQIDRSLRELLDRGFLVAATYRHGERWWSNRLTHEELWREIELRKLRAAKAAQRRKVDLSNDARIEGALKKEGVHLVPVLPSLEI